jgi:protein TonB
LPPRNLGWFAASAAAHAVVLGALIFFARIPAPEHQWVLAYVIDPAAGAGAATGSPGGAAEAWLEPAPLSPPERPPRLATPSAQADPAVASTIDPPARASVARLDLDGVAIRDPRHSTRTDSGARPAGGSGAGGGASGARAGRGAGTLAHADYGASPAPDYPVRARRLGEQGTVMLRVLVAADGSVLRAEVAQSSGYQRLDDAALEAVGKRWRFVAARRDGQAVESWVLVPIRFTLTEASAAP